MAQRSLTFFRVMCGRKAHSQWVTPESMAWKIAVDKGLASADRAGRFYFGPLVWIEVGIRARARARTVPVHEERDGIRLALRNRPTLPPQSS